MKPQGLSRKLKSHYTGPYKIVGKRGPVTFQLDGLGAQKGSLIHANRLKAVPAKSKHSLRHDQPRVRTRSPTIKHRKTEKHRQISPKEIMGVHQVTPRSLLERNPTPLPLSKHLRKRDPRSIIPALLLPHVEKLLTIDTGGNTWNT